MARIALIIGAFALVVVSCGGDESQDGVASLENSESGLTSTTVAQIEADVALLEFSQCMRDEGIPLPDIAIDDEGAPILDPALLETIDVQSDEFNDAFATCQPILADSQFSVDLDPELEAVIMDQLFAFSQCMRDNGFDDFPDPADVSLGPPYPISIFAQFSEPEFEAAIELCQRDLAFPGLDG